MKLNRDDLHEYQKYGVDFIINNPISALMLECGLGKTITTLTAVSDLMYDYFEISKVLIIAPLRVGLSVWKQECDKWEQLKYLRCSIAVGSVSERQKAMQSDADVYIINRENVEWLVKNYPFDFDMVVIDELSSFKSHQSKRFRALRKVRPKVGRIVGLTGTPVPNGLMDLWAEINLLDMGERLGRYITRYRDEYFKPDKRNGAIVYSYKPLPDAEERIYGKISDICVSMKAADYLEMPERVDNIIEVGMNDKETAMYKRLEKEMLLPFADGDIDAVNAASLSNKLLQLANGAVYDENGKVRKIHSRKLDELEDLIEAANGKPVLVYYSYKHDRDRISERFNAREIKDDKDISEWNAGKIQLAIAHPASCGHGLNLQSGGSTIVWFGLTWSLELYQQANARLYRQGQKNTVVVHHIITKGTVDEKVMTALKNKDIGQASLMEAKEYLNQLIAMDDAINRKQQRLATLRDVAINTTPNYTDEAVQRTREKSPLENIMTKIVDLDREIDEDIDALVDFKAEVWEQLDKIPDERYVRVLWLRYAEQRTWGFIANCMNFTSRYVRKLHIQALKELDKVIENKKDHPCST